MFKPYAKTTSRHLLSGLLTGLLLLLLNACQPGESPVIGKGGQPRAAVDSQGTVRLVYGEGQSIFFSASTDQGQHFSSPVQIATIDSLGLGMWRGPQIASSKDFTMVVAADNMGNIHSFQLDHKTNEWSKLGAVNDAPNSAPEGLVDLAADQENRFYATWLDVRPDKNNKIAFSRYSDKAWSPNQIIYTSPDTTVCSCCKPTVAVNDEWVFVMFRNQIEDHRDMYFLTSDDDGMTFGDASKLGFGTWVLKACPMDGGDLVIDDYHGIATTWQREGVVYFDIPGNPEVEVGKGRVCSITLNNRVPLIGYQDGDSVKLRSLSQKTSTALAKGSFLNTVALPNNKTFCVWESDGDIVFKTL